MAEHKPATLTPEEIARKALGVDRKNAAELPVSQGEANVDSGPPQPTQQELAQQARLEEDARRHPRPDRDERLIHVGRYRHTTGRLGGVK